MTTTCTLETAPTAADCSLPSRFAHLDGFIGPLAAVEATIAVAYEAEAILCGWRPTRAAVVGSGSRALLTALALRLRGVDVTMFCGPTPTLREAMLASIVGVRYSTDVDPNGFDVMMHATAVRTPSMRSVLARAFPMASTAGSQHVEAAFRTIIAVETRHPGWLTSLSS